MIKSIISAEFPECSEGCKLNCQARNSLFIATAASMGTTLNGHRGEQISPTQEQYKQLETNTKVKLGIESCAVAKIILPDFMYATCGRILILDSDSDGGSSTVAIGVNRNCPVPVGTTGVAYGVQEVKDVK